MRNVSLRTTPAAPRITALLLAVLFLAPSFIHAAETNADTSAAERIARAPFPRIAMLWQALRDDRSVESIARHDLVMIGGGLGLQWDGKPVGLAQGYTTQSLEAARRKVADIRRLNPRAVILTDVLFYEWPDAWLPDDHPWWMRRDGQRQQFWPGTHRMDWYNPDYRAHVVKRTLAAKAAGIDGVFFDNLRREPEPWVAFLSDVRQVVGDDFLLFANSGYDVGTHDFAAPFLNGIMYESGWSHDRTDWDETIRKMQHTETLLRQPRISLIERFEETRSRAGWPGDPRRGQKPPADPAARRWSLCFALATGDFYYLFADNTSHRHDWYPEYDVKIGFPKEPGQRINAHAWQRRYDRALVVVNLPGAKEPYDVRLDAPARDALTGAEGRTFTIPAGEGRILLAE